MSGVSPEEPLWQRPEGRFRPFGRIFHEKCGLEPRYPPCGVEMKQNRQLLKNNDALIVALELAQLSLLGASFGNFSGFATREAA